MDLQQFGKELKALRLKHGIGLKALALLLKCDTSRLAALEQGRMHEDGEIEDVKLSPSQLPIFLCGKKPTSKQLDRLAKKFT